MAQVTFEKIRKVYPDGTRAVNDLNLVVEDGEFMVLVGPSDCGKTTALRSPDSRMSPRGSSRSATASEGKES